MEPCRNPVVTEQPKGHETRSCPPIRQIDQGPRADKAHDITSGSIHPSSDPDALLRGLCLEARFDHIERVADMFGGIQAGVLVHDFSVGRDDVRDPVGVVGP